MSPFNGVIVKQNPRLGISYPNTDQRVQILDSDYQKRLIRWFPGFRKRMPTVSKAFALLNKGSIRIRYLCGDPGLFWVSGKNSFTVRVIRFLGWCFSKKWGSQDILVWNHLLPQILLNRNQGPVTPLFQTTNRILGAGILIPLQDNTLKRDSPVTVPLSI